MCVSGDVFFFFWQPICVTHCSFSPVSEDVCLWTCLSITESLRWRTPTRSRRHQQTGCVRCSSPVMMLQNSIDYLGTSDIPLVADNNSSILVSVVFTMKLVYSTQTQTSSEHTWLSQRVLFLTPSLRPQLVFYTLVSHATMVSRPAGNFDLSVSL